MSGGAVEHHRVMRVSASGENDDAVEDDVPDDEREDEPEDDGDDDCPPVAGRLIRRATSSMTSAICVVIQAVSASVMT